MVLGLFRLRSACLCCLTLYFSEKGCEGGGLGMPVGNFWTCRDRVSKALLVDFLVRCVERSGQRLGGRLVEKRVIHDGIPDRRMLSLTLAFGLALGGIFEVNLRV